MEEETVPTYTEIDSHGLTSWLDESPELTAQLRLPLTHWPHPPWHPAADSQWILPPPEPKQPISTPDVQTTNPSTALTLSPDAESSTPSIISTSSTTTSPIDFDIQPAHSDPLKETLYTLQTRLITTLFTAITTKNTEAVHLLITGGFLSPDCTNEHGLTPLIAAIDAGNGTMVCTLVSLGATVNHYGRDSLGKERTPLMVAAQLGRLPLVKLLKEDFGADDAVIAPDGQLALRLAAGNGHREVVEYLPVRRGGAWRRWKVHHEVMVRRVRGAMVNIYKFGKFFVWDLPRFLVWTVPKHVVIKPLWKGGKYCWENKRKFGGWCVRQAKAMPGRVERGGKAVWRGCKRAPGEVWRVVKAVPRVVKALAEAFWRFLKRIPKAMKVVAVWIWSWLKRIGMAVGNVFLRIVSAVHTAVMAVFEFFRGTTLKDVWNGICNVFEAVFVALPRTIWSGIKVSGEVALKVLETLFGCIGGLIWLLFKGLIWVVKFVPTQLWRIICSIGSSMAKGYHEILVWLNPKH